MSWCGMVADNARSIADAAVELHENESQWIRAQRRGFEIIATDFNAIQQGHSLLQKVEESIDRLVERREGNFTGAMLRHHQHRATEYMARWIQAKNAKTNQ